MTIQRFLDICKEDNIPLTAEIKFATDSGSNNELLILSIYGDTDINTKIVWIDLGSEEGE